MTDGENNWASDTRTVGGSRYEAAGYYSYNGAVNQRMPNGAGANSNGVNYQDMLKSASGSRSDYHDKSRQAQDELVKEACQNAKDAGVEVYAIGFSTSSDSISQTGLDLLKGCATDVNHFFEAVDAEDLDGAFASIGKGISKLRISK